MKKADTVGQIEYGEKYAESVNSMVRNLRAIIQGKGSRGVVGAGVSVTGVSSIDDKQTITEARKTGLTAGLVRSRTTDAC